MGTSEKPIAVTSRSFSKHEVLRSELLRRYSDVRFNEAGTRLLGGDLINFAKGRHKLIIGLETVDEALLDALPELEVISKYGVGTDRIETAALIRHGVRLGWTGGVNRRSVAELAIAFMISLLRKLPMIAEEIRLGSWTNRTGQELTGRTVGIVGCGHIGKDLATILGVFGCRVLANDVLDFPEFYQEHDVTPVDLEELLENADIVSLHVPLTATTHNMMNATRLSLMKPGSLLVNTARGGLVDEAELKVRLQDGRIAGAAFDVFAAEPPEDTELLQLPNFIATPHIGGSSEEAILAMGRAAILGLDDNAIPSDGYPPMT
ncbi:MAG: phosphoglycerate dehydrogenase [Acidimicrobiia bacterium]|nr:phosphoglycerate dehydrogenase [Acidimicrobiia bacterium]